MAQAFKILDLLGKEVNKDSEEFEEAHQDLIHMFTCYSVLASSFPQVVCIIHIHMYCMLSDHSDTCRYYKKGGLGVIFLYTFSIFLVLKILFCNVDFNFYKDILKRYTGMI